MPQNLFSRLIKYRPKESVTPKENFLTEAFAAAIENDPEFAAELKGRICDSLSIARVNNEVITEVQTQVHLAHNQIIDMIIWLSQQPPCRIGFEIKWGSEQMDSQLSDYQKHLDYIIYLTEPGANSPQIDIPHWTWDQIGSMIETLNKGGNNPPWIRKQFLNWLKEEGMVSTNFDTLDLLALQHMSNLKEKLATCISLFKSKIEKAQKWKELNLTWTPTLPAWKNNRWQTYSIIDKGNQHSIMIALLFGEIPAACIWVESTPTDAKKNKRKLKLNELHTFHLEQLQTKLGFKLVDDPWWLMSSSTPLTKFIDDDGKIPMDKIIDWWEERLLALIECGIIDELKKI